MKTKGAGIIARFIEVSSVRTASRNDLSDGTQYQYADELRKFWRWTGKKPASEWSGAEWMEEMDAEEILSGMQDDEGGESALQICVETAPMYRSGEDPVFDKEAWRWAVGQQDTNIGYWEWVEHQKEANDDGRAD